MKLANKRAIVTGGGSGIGKAMSLHLAAQGCAVAIADINLKTATETAREVESQGGRAIAVQADVSNAESVTAMVAKATEAFGGLDILVNNAGIVHKDDRSIEDTTEEAWDRTLSVNLKSIFLATRAALPALEATGNSAVVNVASIVGMMGSFPAQIAYTASKGGVIALSREMGVVLARRGVRVNAVAPGVTFTPMATQLVADDEAFEVRRQHIPMGRMAEPAEIAAAVAFLASDDASYITSHVMPVDGGMTGAFLTPPD
ncbi:MAG: glucose 1-dehydrogenase [Ruegeria sp.]|nr:glucose 1-dehydrogenase [Ruegeria sp.]